MEQDAVLCAKFILELERDGYYVDNQTLNAAKNIMNDYCLENDCTDDDGMDDNDEDY